MMYAPVNTGYSAEWRPTLSRGGFYETSVYIPASNATTWRARFPVTRSLQTQDTLVDEDGTSSLWLRLGASHMSAGIGNHVSVSSNTGYPGADPEPAERKVGIDAVRFAEVSPTLWYAPLVARATSMSPLPGTWGTGLQVQNLSSSYAANVSLAFYWAVGTPNAGQLAATHTATIPASGSQGWHLPSGGIPSVPAGFCGSLVISSDQPLAVNANAEDTTGPVRVGTVRGTDTPSTTLRFPQLMYEYESGGWNSYAAIQNTTGSSASATIRY